MNALETFREITKKLASLGIGSASKEAELLVRQGLNISLTRIYNDNPEVSEDQAAALRDMVSRRAGREPLQYILGSIDFLGLEITVGKGVLIPRPETELMAEKAINTLKIKNSKFNDVQPSTVNRQPSTMLDLCTGSGCLALALAKAFPDAMVYGTDISDAAISYAIKNADINGIGNVEFLKGHLFGPLGEDRVFDLIISNPPYIRTADIPGLQPEIRDWEPGSALDGGEDGLDLYREIIPSSRRYLSDDGILMLEIGAGQHDEVRGMLQQYGYSDTGVLKDYAGIERILQAKWTR